jgi:hypothetical protein
VDNLTAPIFEERFGKKKRIKTGSGIQDPGFRIQDSGFRITPFFGRLVPFF